MTVNCVIWEGRQEGAKIYAPGKLFKEKFKAFCHGVCAYFLVSLSKTVTGTKFHLEITSIPLGNIPLSIVLENASKAMVYSDSNVHNGYFYYQ